MDKKKNLIILIIVTALILIIPHLVRYFYFDNLLIGSEPYYHARIAETILETNIPYYDALSFGGIQYYFNPYHLVLAATSYLFGITFASILLPFLLGILSFIFFYLILDKLNIKTITNTITAAILITSPFFIYIFTLSNQYSLLIFLNLLAFYLLILNKKSLFILSLFLFSLNPLFGLFEAFLIILLLISYYLYTKDRRLFIVLLLIFIASLVYYVNIPIPKIQDITFIEKNFIKDFLTDIGALTGLGIFNILLALIGLFLKWKDKHTYPFIYFIILVLLISYSYLGTGVFIYLNMILVVFQGIALHKIITMKWQIKLIRNLTILLIVSGLLFSSISFITRLSTSLPNEDLRDSLNSLKETKGENVLSHYKNGFWIEYFAKKKNVMDENFHYVLSSNERYSDSNFIFMSYDLEATKRKIKQYNINYIFITPDMKKGMVWNKEKQGLLFLLRNNETFKNIYSKNDIEIWQVLNK